jgi:hypothetical protein
METKGADFGGSRFHRNPGLGSGSSGRPPPQNVTNANFVGMLYIYLNANHLHQQYSAHNMLRAN